MVYIEFIILLLIYMFNLKYGANQLMDANLFGAIVVLFLITFLIYNAKQYYLMPYSIKNFRLTLYVIFVK